MTDRPLITIGVTVFNAADTLPAALQSALAQDWGNTEIVIVDDASTDASAAIARATLDLHPAARVIVQPDNRGVAAARNAVIDAANGDFIAFFDDDDVSLPDRLTRQHRRITDYEARFAARPMAICHTARRQVYPDGHERIERTMGCDEDGIAPHGAAVARRILYGKPLRQGLGSCAACSQMARRDVYRALGGFDAAFRRGEDTEFNIRLALAGGHFLGIADPLVVQTMTLTADKDLSRERALTDAILRKHKDFLDAEGQGDFPRRWLDAKFDLLDGRTASFARKMLALALASPVRVAARLAWALPNLGFNLRQRAFHRGRR